MAILTKQLHYHGILACMLLYLASNGCATPQGLVRTPLNTWETTLFPTLGFSLDIPKQTGTMYQKYYLVVSDSQKTENSTGRKAVHICFHPMWAGSHLVEPVYMLQVSLTRMTAVRFEKHHDSDFTNKFYGAIESSLSPGPFEKETWKYLRFRKDYRMGNGYGLICDAKLLRMTDKEDADYQADTNAIHRILNSVKLDAIQPSTFRRTSTPPRYAGDTASAYAHAAPPAPLAPGLRP